MKRKLALLLATVMASSCMSVTGFAANFKDINDVPWDGAKAVINSVADKGLFSGYEDNTFRARNNVTYVEAMQMLYNLLEKTGTAKELLATDHYQYVSIMNTYGVPMWAQRAVAYGLHYNILSVMDLAKFSAGGKQSPAPREAVAKMFGEAFAVRYDVDRKAAEAAKFNDYYRISDDAIILVDLLVRLGVISGDNNNNFLPGNNINRAEMAVMLNKSYDVLAKGLINTGEISKVSSNGDSFTFEIKMDNGETRTFNASTGRVLAYKGDSNSEISLARLAVGDKVSLLYNGDSLDTIRVLEGSSTQSKFDSTGYIESLKSGTLTYENENSGETEKIDINGNCTYYLDEKKVRRNDVEDALEDNDKKYAYVGLITDVTTETIKGGNRIEKYSIIEMHVTLTDEYTRTGEVEAFSDSSITYEPNAVGTGVTVKFDSDCAFFIGDKKATTSEMENLVDGGTTYAKVTINGDGKAIKIILSEDKFMDGTQQSTSIYNVIDLTEKRLVLKTGNDETTYLFGSTNPTSNISFFTWDAEEKEWNDTSLSSAESYFDSADRKDDTVYCRLEFNSGGKIKKVQISTKKGAWTSSEDASALGERKGTVDSLSGDTLKLKTSSTAYKLLPQYNTKVNDDRDTAAITGPDPNGNGGTVKNPLTINGVATSSLTVFKRLADSDNITLYVEMRTDSQNNIEKIDARVTEAYGTISEYDQDKKEFALLMDNGQKANLLAIRRPSLGSDDYTLDDLESAGYIGSKVELGFNSDGLINKITVVDSSYNSGTKRVKGVATSADGGLKLKGSSDTYGWLSSNNTSLRNQSMPSTSLDKVKEMINDPNVTVYVEASLSATGKVDSLKVFVQEAEGVYQNYDEDDDIIRIKTDDGNTFSFYTQGKVDFATSGVNADTANDKLMGKTVSLTFDDDGFVEEIDS